jgi:uncharacterized membrane protein YgcG
MSFALHYTYPQVYYKFNRLVMLHEPFLLVVACLLVFGAFILAFRLRDANDWPQADSGGGTGSGGVGDNGGGASGDDGGGASDGGGSSSGGQENRLGGGAAR